MIKRAMVSFTFRAMAITASNTNTLPILDAMASEISLTKKTPKEKTPLPIIRKAAPKLAPELIPNTKGPASGFRNKVCINSPLKESPLPTSIAVKAFGSLYSQIMYAQESFEETAVNSSFSVAEKGISTEPKLMLIPKLTKSRINNNINRYGYLLFNYCNGLKKNNLCSGKTSG